MTPDDITRLEQVSSAIFVGDATWERDGWRALVSDLPNRRANSAHPFTEVKNARATIREVAGFFEAHDRAPLFKLSPGTPASVRAALKQEGLVGSYGADVMTRPLNPAPERRSVNVEIVDHFTDEWLDAYTRGRSVSPSVVRAGYTAAGSVIGAASLGSDAIGLGIVRDGRLGVFNMVTVRAAQRHGKATEILDALLEWGTEQGATSAYLQVVADNTIAHRLYTGRGFRVSYAYEYWAYKLA